ncbi:ArsR/SmtB family transcription factor [Limnobacter litoralis]|uniref:Transcriptional regulator n=1 Tax=Limnobacter litoralis TaxID=481366 RepID=A0ABQ5YU54_9BURK|nr:helix-turn-helix domain-containing protein [Limnobacter litoralis]GLR26940.1 transcriptional regulator [Limnobacter litoralis]
MEIKETVKQLSALAQESRLRIFRALVVKGPEGMTPGQLVDQLGYPPATLSFHLRGLLQAGLVTQTRESRHLYYSADFKQMNALVNFLTENCCSGQSCNNS